MTGTEWQNYPALSGSLAANDTFLALDADDESASSSGTVHQVTAAGLAAGALSWVNAVASGADPTGGSDSTAAIQSALLSFGTLGSWSQGQGGVVYLPPGQYKISKTLIRPSGVTLQGAGWASQITLVTGSNCDVIQNATYNSSSQAAILGVSASAIANGFFGGIRDLAIHGDAFYTTVPGYCHGINVTTNPLTTAIGGDPEFDTMISVENVWIKACTGDGYFHNGRSGAFLKRVLVESVNGVAVTPSFDTTMVDCLAAFNGAGFYFDHQSNTGAGNKSYNAFDLTWVSGTSYAPNGTSSTGGNTCVYNGTMYWCIAAVSGSTVPSSDGTHWVALVTAGGAWVSGTSYSSGDAVTYSGGTYICILAVSGTTAPSSDSTHWAAPTPAWVSGTSYSSGSAVAYAGTMYYCLAAVSGTTAPSSDPTHWAAVSGATAPQATGIGAYWDTNAGEHSHAAIDCQQNSKSDYYFHGPLAGGIDVTGTSAYVNFNNGQPAYNSGNTANHNAAVTFDGCSGVNMRLSSSKQATGSGVICTSLNSPGSNTLIATTDGTEPAVFYGGTPAGFAMVNGLAHFGEGTDTSGTAAASSPSFTTATAKQLSTVQDVMLYIAVQTSAALAVAIGPTSTPATSVMPSQSYALGLYSVRVPAGWYVKITGTITDLTITQVTC